MLFQRIVLMALFLLCAGLDCNVAKNKNNEFVVSGFYITPRSPNYGWIDKGIFHFELNEKSIRVPWGSQSSIPFEQSDSIYELYYTENLDIDVNALASNLCNMKFSEGSPRCIIIVERGIDQDTILINGALQMKWGGNCYIVNPMIWQDLLQKLPKDVASSWKR